MTTVDPARLAVCHSLAASLARAAEAHRAVVVGVVFFEDGDAASIVNPCTSRENDAVWIRRALAQLKVALDGQSDFETMGRAPPEGEES